MTPGSPSRPVRLLIVAAAGYGKTAALETALPTGGRRVSAGEAMTADLSGVPAWGAGSTGSSCRPWRGR